MGNVVCMTEGGGMTLTLDWESYRKEASHA